MRTLSLVAALIASLLAPGCGVSSPGSPVPSVPEGPADPSSEMRPELMVADPTRPSNGEVVELTFPRETMRGIAFVLERQENGVWQYLYDMVSDANGGAPHTVPALSQGFGYDDVGVGGPGPDRVRIPEDAEAGRYRICTANAGDEFCTGPIDIVPHVA